MKTNKETALELLFENSYNVDIQISGIDSKETVVPFNIASYCVALSHEYEWFHPYKGEFPNEGQRVLAFFNYDDNIRIVNYTESREELFENNVKAWGVLPKYNF